MKECIKTDRGVETGADVARERARTHRCVIDRIETVVKECLITRGGVVAAVCVTIKRLVARGRVVAARIILV